MPSKDENALLRGKLILKGARTLMRLCPSEFAELPRDEMLSHARMKFQEISWHEQIDLVPDWQDVFQNPAGDIEEEQHQAQPAACFADDGMVEVASPVLEAEQLAAGAAQDEMALLSSEVEQPAAGAAHAEAAMPSTEKA